MNKQRIIIYSLLGVFAIVAIVVVLGGFGSDVPESNLKVVNERPGGGEDDEAAGDDGEMSFDGDEADEGAAKRKGQTRAPRSKTARAAKPKQIDTGDDAADANASARTKNRDNRPKQVVVETNFLAVSRFLDRTEVREALGYTGLLQEADLGGQPPSKTYNSIRLQSATGFGVGLQVWKIGSSSAASRKFDDLYAQSIGGERSEDAGNLSYRTEHHKLKSIVFLDKRKSTVAWLTCESKLCTWEQAADLARRVHKGL